MRVQKLTFDVARSRRTPNDWMRSISRWLCAAACAVYGAASYATPAITGIAGNIADGQTVTISGSGFGGGPTVVLFDDFESGNGRDGQAIPLTSPEVGQWSAYPTDGRPRYSPNARSGKHGFRITDPAFGPNNGNAQGSFLELLPSPATEIFISYAFFIPPGTTFPGASIPGTLPERSTWKGFWLFDGPDGFAGNGQSDVCLPTWVNHWALGGNSGTIVDSGFGDWFSFENWNRFSVWMKANPKSPVLQSGTIFLQTTNLDKGHLEHTWTDRSPFQGPTAYNNDTSSGKWDRFTLPGWWGNADNTHNQMTYDDVYVATGPNAAARVEIGDAPTYGTSRSIAISTPQSWSNNKIVFTLRAGPFTDLSNKYLYVIDADNNVSKGYPLGPAGPAPNPPIGVGVK